MHRFFVSPECFSGDVVHLPEPVARQLRRVLRARPGDDIILRDDSGQEFRAVVETLETGEARARVTSESKSAGEPDVRITLYQAVLKTDKFELVLQKCTELGVTRFVPMNCERSIPRAQTEGSNRRERWRRIVREAAEQSGRGRLPLVEHPLDFNQACEEADSPALIPWEEERDLGLRQALSAIGADAAGPAGDDKKTLSLFIGPEGGFSRDEVELARSCGITTVTLGKRILRAETAGIAAVAAAMYEMEELGG